ncbi:MAG: arginine deiminase family protein [Bdellovibrionia bacterium]
MYPLVSPVTAVVRNVPATFAKALQQNQVPLDVELAQAQHAAYVEGVKEFVRKVIVLSADVNHPDCCFIEDTAVIVGGKAAISLMGAPSRRGEEKLIRTTLREAGLRTVLLDFPATMDGGDVLFTGKHLIVGLSKRTNADAVKQLGAFITEFPIVTVKVEGSLHLKSVMSIFDPEILLFGECKAGHDILAQLRGQGVIDGHYHPVMIPDPVASNVLYMGRNIFIQDGFPASEAVFIQLAGQRNKQIFKVPMSELIKADGALTCCSLLFA